MTVEPAIAGHGRDRVKRVLIATSKLAAVGGGTERYVAATAEALAGAGLEVAVVSAEPAQRELIGVDVEIVPGIARRARFAARDRDALDAAIRAHSPDVVHLHDIHDVRLVADIRQDVPVVWGLHNFYGCTAGYKYFPGGAPCHRGHGAGCMANIVLRGCGHTRLPRPSLATYRLQSVLLDGLRTADRVIVGSRYLAAEIANNGVEKISIVAPFVPDLPPPAPPPDTPRVLFVGRVTPHKGVLTLLQAMVDTEAELEICGDGWGMGRARHMAEALGIAGRVRFSGWLVGAALAEAYERATLVAVPSIAPESFGLVGIEAMAHSRPVVASGAGGIPEWLEHERTGLLHQPADRKSLADALARLLTDPSLAARMGACGRSAVNDRFSVQPFVERQLAAYAAATAAAKNATASVPA